MSGEDDGNTLVTDATATMMTAVQAMFMELRDSMINNNISINNSINDINNTLNNNINDINKNMNNLRAEINSNSDEKESTRDQDYLQDRQLEPDPERSVLRH